MNAVVQSGPFIGMKIPYSDVWKDYCLGIQVLGCYEQELHFCIEAEITRLNRLKNPKIVNIGCGGGYYAVGMACRVPLSSVWVIDSNPTAIDLTIEAGIANGRLLIAERICRSDTKRSGLSDIGLRGRGIKIFGPDRISRFVEVLDDCRMS